MTMVRKRHSPLARKDLACAGAPARIQREIHGLLHRARERFQSGAYGSARAFARRTLELEPNNIDAYHMLGAVAFAEQAYDEAQILFGAAVNLDRRAPHLRYHLGNAQRLGGKHEAAIASFRKALKLNPAYDPAYLALADALRGLNGHVEAVGLLQRYLQRRRGDADGHHAISIVYRELGEFDLALRHAREALALRPDHAGARKTVATTLLLVGNFKEGWPAWLNTFTRVGLLLPDPASRDASFRGKRVVVYPNEGVGDEVMFASCVPDLAICASETTLYCEERLAPLFQRSFQNVRVLPMAKQGARRTVGFVGPDDLHVLTSYLPAFFRFDFSNVPVRTSYLAPDRDQVAEWRRRLDGLGSGLKVGVSWRGGVDPVNRAQRSIPLRDWTPILQLPHVHFVNLQYGAVTEEIEEVRRHAGVDVSVWNDADPLIDLDFFAAEIAALDLVISVDNTTVHMAGALGTPVWTMLPRFADWRWMLNGSTTAWYASMRLFRQGQQGHWDGVLKEISTLLSSTRSP